MTKCNKCKTPSKEATTDNVNIPLIIAESEAVRQHKTIKHLIIGWILTVILLFVSNLAWVIYESQYETVIETYEVQQDTEQGSNNCIINGGEINNGETDN